MDFAHHFRDCLSHLADSGHLTAQINRYHQTLLRWNKTYNLTASCADAALIPHFTDSLYAGLYLRGHCHRRTLRIADLGSGAGFPAIPAAIVNPRQHFSLFEIDANKSAFLRQAAINLGLKNLSVVGDYRQTDEKYDIVMAKAFVHPSEFLSIFRQIASAGGLGLVFINPQTHENRWLAAHENAKKMLISEVIYFLPQAEEDEGSQPFGKSFGAPNGLLHRPQSHSFVVIH